MTANRISPDPDRTWVDGILRFTEPVGYGPTMLLLRYSDRSVPPMKAFHKFLRFWHHVLDIRLFPEDSTCLSEAFLTQSSFPLFDTGFLWVQCFLLELSEFAIAAACAFRAEEMPSLISCWMAIHVMTGVSDC
ncbi:hypothetical protein Tco_0932647 [Tanacetum coccineum]